VDLGGGGYAAVGRLDDRVSRGKKPLVVCTFVFVQLHSEDVPFRVRLRFLRYILKVTCCLWPIVPRENHKRRISSYLGFCMKGHWTRS
jgi:hypothetical protein